MRLPTRSPLVSDYRAAERTGRSPRRHDLRFWPKAEFLERRHERSWREGLSSFVLQLSRALRSGLSIDRALHEVVESAPQLPVRVRAAVGQLGAGRSLDVVLTEWLRAAPFEPERLLVTAVALGQRCGANLAPVLDGISDAIRDDLALDARRRVLLVQAKLSTAVLVVLPIGFAAASSLARGSFTFRGPVGIGLLVAGLFLDGLGVWWMRRLLRALR